MSTALDKLPGFAWPVPAAFLDALFQCRFSEGDLLHSDGAAYEVPWGEAQRTVRYAIQNWHQNLQQLLGRTILRTTNWTVHHQRAWNSFFKTIGRPP